jgi:hypothetical protein
MLHDVVVDQYEVDFEVDSVDEIVVDAVVVTAVDCQHLHDEQQRQHRN